MIRYNPEPPSQRLPFTLGALTLALLLSACGGGSGDNSEGGDTEPDESDSENVSVHDPSVIKVDGDYYVFGSHLAGAKTDDLMEWEQVANNVTAENPLFDDVTDDLAEALDWAETDTLWAMDITQLEDGRFYMYYNASKGDEPIAAMGLAVADNVEGPYEDRGIFLRSGNKEDDGTDGYLKEDFNAYEDPHTIDPHVLYDQQDRLWMIYGSYSGGLFALEMNPNTGLPIEDDTYGKHLMGGNHARIEAPYVLYSPEAEYYYLFTTFGGLDADGGYNMRVARSKSPDGPYFDAQGNDMADVQSDPDEPIFDDESIEDGAMKLMGNFQFEGGAGYVSPGHNSTYYEEETGEHLIFFHTRFTPEATDYPDNEEAHEVRVHRMHINEDGWPVIAPHRYVAFSEADEAPEEAIAEDEVPGTYELINHDKDISAGIKDSMTVELEADGQISGEVSGDWTYGDDNRITVTLEEAGTFKGVASREWSRAEGDFVVSFSALSEDGVSVWGSRRSGD